MEEIYLFVNNESFHKEFEVAKAKRFLVFAWIRGSEISSGISGGCEEMLTFPPLDQGHMAQGTELQVEGVSTPLTC